MIALLVLAQTVQTLAPGIAQAVPATAWNCNLQAADGSKFSVAGVTPLFPVGWEPNSFKIIAVQSTHPEAFQKKVDITLGEARGEWFREFQVSSGYPGVPEHRLNLMLRKEGASIAYVTRYLSTGRQIPYEYYAVGLCNADFSPAAGQERGRR